MTKRLEVLLAVKALVETALPGVEVLGLENEGAAPELIPECGRVVVRAGDPGQPTMDLSPPAYNYEHSIPLELATYGPADKSMTAEEALDAMFDALSAGIVADRTAGGQVDYLDAIAPQTGHLYVPGAKIARAADVFLIATYATSTPL